MFCVNYFIQLLLFARMNDNPLHVIGLQRPKVCRICRGLDNDDLISVHLVQDNVTIARMIYEVSGIQVTKDRSLPQNICLSCMDRLKNAYSLRLQCIDADRILRAEMLTAACPTVYPTLGTGIRDSKPMVKLEITTLNPDGYTTSEIENLNQDDGIIDPNEIDYLDEVDIKMIFTDTMQGHSRFQYDEESVLSSDELLTTNSDKKSNGGTDYEIVYQSEHYEQIRFIVADCCGCLESFAERKSLLAHGSMMHKPEKFEPPTMEGTRECPICYRQFSNFRSISLHRAQIDIDRFYCRHCGALLESREDLVTHLQTLHSITEEKEEMSDNCFNQDAEIGNQTPVSTLASYRENQYKIVRTNKDYNLIEFLWFCCCGCNDMFESRQEFEQHSEQVHLPQRTEVDECAPFECNVCHQRFAKKCTLFYHKNKPNKQKIVCKICGGIFQAEGSFCKHINLVHRIVPDESASKDKSEIIADGKDYLDNHVLYQEDEPLSQEVAEESFMQEIEYIEDTAAEVSSDDPEETNECDSDALNLEKPNNTSQGPNQALKYNKYITTKQRKEIGLVPGNALRIVEKLEGYNIVEISKERCCRCLQFFTSLDELNEHTAQHREESKLEDQNSSKPIKYQCEFCLKRFDIALIYVIHKRVRVQKQFYQCRLCNFVLDSESRLRNHMLHNEKHAKFFNLVREDISDQYTVLKLPGVRCCGCRRYFANEKELAVHSRQDHPPDPSKDISNRQHACEVCNRRCYSKLEIETHQLKARAMLRYYCKLCDFNTPSKARILKHLYSAIHNQSLPNIMVKKIDVGSRKAGMLRYCCFTDCYQPFHDAEKLLTHVELSHNREKEQNFAETTDRRATFLQCHICGRSFKNATALKQHRYKPKVPKKFVCTVCGVSKQHKAALAVHEMSHSGERPFGCQVCDKRFASQTILKAHMKCHEPKQYGCPECGEKFARSENLKRHTRHRHLEATYSCNYCDRKLKTRESQVLHERSHTGEKPFMCRTEGCEKRYASITDRRRHEMANHTGERPHKCSYCGSSFVRKRQLTIHERKHTGERPFVCTNCGKAFIDAPLLKKHLC